MDLESDRSLVNGLSFTNTILEQKFTCDAMLFLNLANPVQDTAEFCLRDYRMFVERRAQQKKTDSHVEPDEYEEIFLKCFI